MASRYVRIQVGSAAVQTQRMQPVALAIDIGGTKVAAALVDADGRIVRRDEVPTPESPDDEAVFAAVLTVADRVRAEHSVCGVGVGCGGPMQWPEGNVSPLNIPAWRDFPLRERLRTHFPEYLVRVTNDAIAMAIAEHAHGHGQGTDSFLGVVVSTGVGGGLIVGGKPVTGPTGNAGHVGHVVVDPLGPRCGCGARGCLEAIARGPAVVGWAVDAGWRPSGDTRPDGRALLAAARAGDPIAIAAFDRAGTALGAALGAAAHLLDLDAVAIGGGLANAGNLLLEPLQREFAQRARMDFAARCRIGAAAFGTDAGLIGSAALVTDSDRYWTGGAD
jgi:glucokinase